MSPLRRKFFFAYVALNKCHKSPVLERRALTRLTAFFRVITATSFLSVWWRPRISVRNFPGVVVFWWTSPQKEFRTRPAKVAVPEHYHQLIRNRQVVCESCVTLCALVFLNQQQPEKAVSCQILAPETKHTHASRKRSTPTDRNQTEGRDLTLKQRDDESLFRSLPLAAEAR